MILTAELLKYLADEVNSMPRREAREEDYKRFLMFNGKLKEILREAISKEYKKPESIQGLMERLIPINIMQKIVTKLAGVYTEPAARTVADASEEDQALLDLYIEGMCYNQRQKEANRYFKLFKRNLQELYVDSYGVPCARNLPRHTYEVFSFNPLTPNYPEVVIKILNDSVDTKEQRLAVWSNENHVVIDGTGKIDRAAMMSMQNEDGVNPYGALPFVYTNESSYSVDPIQDDDLVRMSIVIPVLLTDLAFAEKYMSFGVLYTIGDVGDIPFNPNTVIPLNFGPDGQKPEIGSIKPDVDTDKVLLFVESLLAMLLTTKNLSTATVSSKLTSDNAASGIAKMLDQAESVEDKRDQQQYFYKAEQDTWNLISKYLIPVWRKAGKLSSEYNQEFSSSFKVSVKFQEPKVMITEREQIEISALRIKEGFSTQKRELAILYPQMTSEEIDVLEDEIEEEQTEKQQAPIDEINGEMDGVESDVQDNPE